MRTYTKKPLTYEEQLSLLLERGLIINDIKRAKRYLSVISYYRLSAYFLPYSLYNDRFIVGTTFDDILNLYLFDRELRLFVFDAIERIEVSLRAQMVYQLSLKYRDSHWLDKSVLFKPSKINPKTRKILHVYQETQDIIERNKSSMYPEVFIKHYISTYNKPSNPPSWMSIELLTIGELSRLYSALKNNSDKKGIADFYGLHHNVLSSWLHTLVYVRNICAHHARLWNRDFAIKPDVLLKPKRVWLDEIFNSNNNRCFYFLSLVKYLLISINPNNHFKEKLIALFEKYPTVPIAYMGIPTTDGVNLVDWKKQPVWM
jgi:abortive infection bacteriophage resistance protein